MSYCFNLQCPNPADPANKNQLICCNCGFDLLLQNRYRAVQKLCGEDSFKVYAQESGQYKVITINPLLDNLKIVLIMQHKVKVFREINHPGIPKMDQDGYYTKNDDTHYLVMEYIEGLTLKDWMIRRNKKPISEKLAIKWLRQMVKILDKFHRKHYYFRDINSKAITVKPDGNLALTDYQMLPDKFFDNKGNFTGINCCNFCSPSQYTIGVPSQEITNEFDFFCLGRIWVFLLTGKHAKAFPENPRTGKLLWRKYAPHISQHFADLLDYLMATFPGNRPQNCQVILKCIREIKQEQAKTTSNYQETSQTKTQKKQKTKNKKKKNQIIYSLINWLNQCWISTWNFLRTISQYFGLRSR
ncbi:tyrosine kinase family protein [Lyngbya aestuarii BL J]|uniref:Tyrosine kinase family protein n=1 Tax=Lyngbya aestuarii BL J TaxID=1348334 RepID=U7QGT8_9CYAN|nr:protein kinase [Lyngbya aestuarii]ERT06295.1 tyrosine kinase family protein [Lyngbya aestuarii BL J]